MASCAEGSAAARPFQARVSVICSRQCSSFLSFRCKPQLDHFRQILANAVKRLPYSSPLPFAVPSVASVASLGFSIPDPKEHGLHSLRVAFAVATEWLACLSGIDLVAMHLLPLRGSWPTGSVSVRSSAQTLPVLSSGIEQLWSSSCCSPVKAPPPERLASSCTGRLPLQARSFRRIGVCQRITVLPCV